MSNACAVVQLFVKDNISEVVSLTLIECDQKINKQNQRIFIEETKHGHWT